MRCKFYGSAVGCRQGDLCRFQHDTSAASSSSSNPQQSSRRPAGDHLGPTRLLADNLNTSRASLAASLDVRYHCRDIRPSSHDEREMARHLVLSAEESGRGVDLPAERRMFIEARAAALNFTVIGAFSFRRQLIRQMVGSTRFYEQENAMGSPQEALAHALNLEVELERWLGDNGIKYLTQEELVERGLKATPDFYILDDLRINGREVRWIDCKTYYASRVLVEDRNLPLGKLRKQKAVYNDLFGAGCFLFLCGFAADLVDHADFKDVLLLDGHQIDRNKLYREEQALVGSSLGLSNTADEEQWPGLG